MKSFTKAIWWIVLLVGIGGMVAMCCGCVDGASIEACGKACGSVGVRFVNSELCQCNPQPSKAESCK